VPLSIKDFLARAEKIREAAVSPAPAAPFKPVWRLKGVSDVFECQRCRACGSSATIHLGRFVVLESAGARRLTRHAVAPEGTPLSQEIWHTSSSICIKCWQGAYHD
jgi:hypothetical protein